VYGGLRNSSFRGGNDNELLSCGDQRISRRPVRENGVEDSDCGCWPGDKTQLGSHPAAAAHIAQNSSEKPLLIDWQRKLMNPCHVSIVTKSIISLPFHTVSYRDQKS
jgi:hypothetical protein